MAAKVFSAGLPPGVGLERKLAKSPPTGLVVPFVCIPAVSSSHPQLHFLTWKP